MCVFVGGADIVREGLTILIKWFSNVFELKLKLRGGTITILYISWKSCLLAVLTVEVHGISVLMLKSHKTQQYNIYKQLFFLNSVSDKLDNPYTLLVTFLYPLLQYLDSGFYLFIKMHKTKWMEKHLLSTQSNAQSNQG